MNKIWEKVAERSEYCKVMIYYYQNGITVSSKGGNSLVLNHPDLTMFPVGSFIQQMSSYPNICAFSLIDSCRANKPESIQDGPEINIEPNLH